MRAGRPFSDRARQHGVLSSLSTPLVANDRPIGALNFYGLEECAFSEDDEQLGAGFATQAAIVVSNAQAYWGARENCLNLDEAMRSRAVIEQAKGIIMARSGLSPGCAFDILVRASQRENRKLRHIASELVERAPHPKRPTARPGRAARRGLALDPQGRLVHVHV